MKKTIFISYHFDDKAYKGEIKKWLEEAGVTVISTDETDLRPEGENAVTKKIKAQIQESDYVLILVGDCTHNRPWVDYEVAVARSLSKQTFWIRLTNRTGAPPKEVRNLESILFNKMDILKLIR